MGVWIVGIGKSVMANTKVIVAMSGGVDSSVSAALLIEQGYEVSGLMMRLWSEPGQFAKQRDNRCCTRDQMLDAHFVAHKLGIPFEVIDAVEPFKQAVVDGFIEGYANGITPNPCLACNRHIRFTFLLDEAKKRDAAYLATGHYAQVRQDETGLFELHRGADPRKDQSYVLSVLNQDQIRHAMFPVGGYTKPEVRDLASGFGLPVASKHDSQDLCFLADGDYRRFLVDHGGPIMTPGPIEMRDGTVLGQHEGLPNYTIGQRKGLGISYSEPLYVISKEISTNKLIVGVQSELGQDTLGVHDVNWISGVSAIEPFRATVKIRYQSKMAPAQVTPTERGIQIKLDTPLPDVTPGQAAVVYDGTRVVCSGLIAARKFVLAN